MDCSNLLKTRLVWHSNGRFVLGCQMVFWKLDSKSPFMAKNIRYSNGLPSLIIFCKITILSSHALLEKYGRFRQQQTDRETNSLTPYTGVFGYFLSVKFTTSLLASLPWRLKNWGDQIPAPCWSVTGSRNSPRSQRSPARQHNISVMRTMVSKIKFDQESS